SVFKMTMDGTLTTLISFDGTNGAKPCGGVAQGRDGDLYGTTAYRKIGTNWTYGTLFRLTTNGLLTTLVSFNGTNALNPIGYLSAGRDGNLYGAIADINKYPSLD